MLDLAHGIIKVHRLSAAVVRDAVHRAVLVFLLGVMRRHPGTAIGAPNQPLQQEHPRQLRGTVAAIAPQRLDLRKQHFLDQSLLFALKALLVKSYLATVNGISQNMIERHFAPRLARTRIPTTAVQFAAQSGERRKFGETVIHESQVIRFRTANDQLLVFEGVSVGYVSTVPQTFLSSLKHLVARAVRRHLTLKLREV